MNMWVQKWLMNQRWKTGPGSGSCLMTQDSGTASIKLVDALRAMEETDGETLGDNLCCEGRGVTATKLLTGWKAVT